MRENNRAERVGEIINRLYLPSAGRGRSKKLKIEYARRLVISHWEKIVSPEIARNARPDHFSGNALIIAATPVWASQLSYFRQPLIDAVNGYVASELIKEIRLVSSLSPFEKTKPSTEVSPLPSSCGKKGKGMQGKAGNDGSIKKIPPLRHFSAQSGDGELAAKIERANVLRHSHLIDLAKAGAHYCAGDCGTLVEAELEYCPVCEGKRRRRHYERIREKYAACPWANYREINEYEPCRPEEAGRIHQEMLRKQAEKVPYREKSDAAAPLDSYTMDEMILVMLYRSIPPEKLTSPVMSRALYELRYDLKNTPLRAVYKLKGLKFI